jgi:SulP family sulfate permease
MMESKGIRLHLSGLKLPAMQVLERAGLLAPGPMLFSYRTDGEALAALMPRIDGIPAVQEAEA